MFMAQLERTLLAAYLRTRRRFGRCSSRHDRLLRSRYIDHVAAAEDLRDHVMTEGEIESRKYLVKLGPDAEVRVIRTATIRVRPRRDPVPGVPNHAA